MLKLLFTIILSVTIGLFLLAEDGKSSLYLVPSFSSCSIYLKNVERHKDGLIAKYRKIKTDQEWQEAYPLAYDDVEKEYRGSIIGLDENTDYEILVSDFKRDFKTWSSTPPIAKTILINKLKLDGQLVISDKGTANGWIKYTAPKGYIFKASADKDPAILFNDAKFVILENLTVSGGGGNAILVQQGENIRIINCDISGWGTAGVQNFQKGGQYFLPDGTSVCASKMSGINIDQTLNLVVERCYIHDPIGRANSWRFSHPSGPDAIWVYSRGGTVIRYNDLIGSDPHRWDDVIGGSKNGSERGSFYRDADIYGNMLAFANDDGIELDGGQMNIRLYRNKIEGCLCGISTAPCLLGPSYIFNNLILNLSDDSGIANSAIKNNSGWMGKGQLFYFNNTIFTPNSNDAFTPYIGISTSSPFPDLLKGSLKNNVFFCQGSPVSLPVFKFRNVIEGNLFFSYNQYFNEELLGKMTELKIERDNILVQPEFADIATGNFRLKKGGPGTGYSFPIPGFHETPGDIGAFENNSAPLLPFRPLPVSVNKEQLNFCSNPEGRFDSQEISVKFSDLDFKESFLIRQNKAFDWFEVAPAEGKITDAAEIKLTVRILPEKLEGPWVHRGIFLIRFANGLSRPVMVYANPDKELPVSIPKDGINILIKAIDGEGEKYPVIEDQNGKYIYLSSKNEQLSLNPEGDGVSFAFNIPQNGRYMIALKMKSKLPVGLHNSCFFSLDRSMPDRMDFQFCKTSWTWKPVLKTRISSIQATKDTYRISSFETIKLSKGRHTITLYPRESIFLESIIITDNLSQMMNPRGY